MLDRFLAEYAVSVLGGIVLLICAWFLALWVDRLIRRSMERRAHVDKSFVPVVARSARVGILIVAALVVLDEVGVEVASIIAALGIFGFAIGLALRGLLANVFTGVAIFSLKPYKTGDEIVAERVTGVVESVHLFHTVLVSEGSYLSVPNDVVWAKPLRNLSRPRPWRVDADLVVDCAPPAPPLKIDSLQRDLTAAMAALPPVSKSVQPRVRVMVVTDKTVTLRASAWCSVGDILELRASLSPALRGAAEAQGAVVRGLKLVAEEKPAPEKRPAAKKPAAKARAAKKAPPAPAALPPEVPAPAAKPSRRRLRKLAQAGRGALLRKRRPGASRMVNRVRRPRASDRRRK